MNPTVPCEVRKVRFYSISDLENRREKDKLLTLQVLQLIGPIAQWVKKKKKSRMIY